MKTEIHHKIPNQVQWQFNLIFSFALLHHVYLYEIVHWQQTFIMQVLKVSVTYPRLYCFKQLGDSRENREQTNETKEKGWDDKCETLSDSFYK